MVKKTVLILAFFTFQSCIYYRNTEGSIRASKFQIKPYKNNISLLDTNIVYQIKAHFYNDNYKPFKITKLGGEYLRFYSNGKVSYFSHLPKTKYLKREFFNPKTGRMGYYGKSKNGYSIKILLDGDGGGYINREKITIFKDSIILIDSFGYGSVYKPIKIQKLWLKDWQADW